MINAVPASWISVAGTCAVSSLVATKNVRSGVELHDTVDAGVRLDPLIVRVKLGAPAAMLDGDSDAITGAG